MSAWDRSLVGREFERERPVAVTAAMIAEFCAAIGETNPLYINPEAAAKGPHGGLIAPPSFAATFRDSDDISEQIARHGVRRLAAGMDVDFIAPIRAGDSISISSRIAESYEKTGRTGAMTFYVIRSTLKNQRGEIVAHIDHRFMHRE
ncbi:MAG: FAS1-like dehydratase domain-containing protein [Candidatus Binataceae bacterium]